MWEDGLPSEAQAIAEDKGKSTRDRVKAILGIAGDKQLHGYTTQH